MRPGDLAHAVDARWVHSRFSRDLGLKFDRAPAISHGALLVLYKNLAFKPFLSSLFDKILTFTCKRGMI